MTLKARITEDMKNAMRAKDGARLSTIRLLLAAIKQREVDERIELTDADVLAVIDKMVKQRRDSISPVRGRQARGPRRRPSAPRSTCCTAYLPAQADGERRSTPLIADDDRSDRCRRVGRHGQGHGGAEAEARRARRHGRRFGPGQGEARG